MKVEDAIRGACAMRNSETPRELMLQWLSDFDGQEWDKVVRHYEGTVTVRPEYDKNTDTESTDLLIQAPYSGIYLDYLVMKIDYFNGDMDRYNAGAAMVNKQRQEWADSYNRSHAWVPSVREIRF